MIPGFSATGVNAGEITVTSFTPAETGTNGSFAFGVLLSKGDSSDKATGSGSIDAAYRGSSSGGGGGGSYTNPDILRGTWERTDTGIWMFRQTGGDYAKSRWGLIGGLWYYFNPDGHMLTGWQLVNGQWYYLYTAEDAVRAAGAGAGADAGVSAGADAGADAGANGVSAGVHAGIKEGSMKTGWHYDARYQRWFWFDGSGAMATGWREIDGVWYYFNPEADGTMGALVEGAVR